MEPAIGLTFHKPKPDAGHTLLVLRQDRGWVQTEFFKAMALIRELQLATEGKA